MLAWGAIGGQVHFTIGGAVVAAIFAVHGPGDIRSHPVFAYRYYGIRDVTTFFTRHITFGCKLGALYPLLQAALGLHAAW